MSQGEWLRRATITLIPDETQKFKIITILIRREGFFASVVHCPINRQKYLGAFRGER